jgi:hypothetical protein
MTTRRTNLFDDDSPRGLSSVRVGSGDPEPEPAAPEPQPSVPPPGVPSPDTEPEFEPSTEPTPAPSPTPGPVPDRELPLVIDPVAGIHEARLRTAGRR